nr:PREDICTED: uncharacterized protein LOC108951234 [Musa acuminata subsp. malaccensis]
MILATAVSCHVCLDYAIFLPFKGYVVEEMMQVLMVKKKQAIMLERGHDVTSLQALGKRSVGRRRHVLTLGRALSALQAHSVDKWETLQGTGVSILRQKCVEKKGRSLERGILLALRRRLTSLDSTSQA